MFFFGILLTYNKLFIKIQTKNLYLKLNIVAFQQNLMLLFEVFFSKLNGDLACCSKKYST